MENDFLKKT